MQAVGANWKSINVKPLTLIFIITGIQLAVVFFTDPMVITFDESMWQYIGRNWIRNGLVPYHGGVDNKSPLIFLIFGISDWFFGVNYWFPRLLGVAVQTLGIYYLYKIAEKTIGKQAGITALSFYGLSLIWRSTGGKYVSFTETYALTSIILAVYFSIARDSNRNAFIGGLFAGLGLGFRLTAVFGILPLLLFTFRKSRTMGVFFLSGVVSTLGVLLLFSAIAGIGINDLLFFGILDNFGSGSVTDHPLAWKIQRFADGFFYSEIILFYPAVVGYFILVKKLDFLKVWLASEFLGIVLLGMYDKSHFKNLLPVFSLMSAFVVGYLIENHQIPAKMILLGIWIVFFPKTFEPLYAIKKLFISKNNQVNPNPDITPDDNESSKKAIGLWIRSHTDSRDQVYIAGYSAEIQLYSERVSPSIYFNVTQTSYAKKKLLGELAANRPAMVVLPLNLKYRQSVDAGLRGSIDSLVARDYQLDTTINHYDIFRLRKPMGP
jgi:Dolichyl-phosphate-mannose-protein mannosyltransferase